MAKKSKKPAKIIAVGRAQEKDTALPVRFLKTITNLQDFPREAAALADLIIAWSALDFTLILILTKLEDTIYEVAAVNYVALGTFSNRTSHILNLITNNSELNKTSKNKIQNHIDDLKDLAEKRNSYIHGSYRTVSPNSELVYFDYKDNPRFFGEERRVIPELIQAHCREVLKEKEELSKIYRATWDS